MQKRQKREREREREREGGISVFEVFKVRVDGSGSKYFCQEKQFSIVHFLLYKSSICVACIYCYIIIIIIIIAIIIFIFKDVFHFLFLVFLLRKYFAYKLIYINRAFGQVAILEQKKVQLVHSKFRYYFKRRSQFNFLFFHFYFLFFSFLFFSYSFLFIVTRFRKIERGSFYKTV